MSEEEIAQQIANEFSSNETLSIAVHKLTNLFALLGQLGWSIASQDSEDRETYNLHGQAKRSFGSQTISRTQLLSHLRTYPNINYLHESSQLVIWRSIKAEHNQPQETPLTKREAEIETLLTDGHTQPEIAKELGISQRTVEKHVQNLYKKKGVHTYNELLFKP